MRLMARLLLMSLKKSHGSLRKAVQDGNLDEGSFLCGAIAGMVNKVEPAKDMIEEMFTQAEELLKR